ncbi:hypothetical protein [Solimonas sp. SE-A11]|uniref:DUF6916 family protein n=1 Tax=Solimonas sp. SE-A11 TaxID=3054954 RepID=UPI00259D0A80|nr:hypothetical protein [Solimonas sp. SE-A11]MDM4772591.1 hypothetical protein [Solimonas sp. SE-A11]
MLSRETLSPCVGQAFELESAEGLFLPLVLVECVALLQGRGYPGSREPFSLVFESPVRPHWPQGNFRLHHAQLPPQVLFVVPLGPAPHSGQMRYQAIFN